MKTAKESAAPNPKKKLLTVLFIILGVILAAALILFLIDPFAPAYDEESYSLADEESSTTVDGEAALFSDEEGASSGKSESAAAEADVSDDWTIMLYLCGTDLESEDGSATDNILECAAVALPENVKLLLCTGGTREWQLEDIDNDRINYLQMSGNGELTKLERKPSASLGDPSSLRAFLSYGVDNFPAAHYGVIIWNHGGGVRGVAFDELYDGDSLSVADLARAFSESGMQAEFIGFDACLMATIETAMALAPYAEYMIASEEVEPGEGWDYEALLSHVIANPDTDGAALGKTVCDSYYAKVQDDCCTLSVTDLSKIEALCTAFDAMAAEMTGVTGDIDRFRTLRKDIGKAENYGGNTDSEGYFNLVDIGDMVLNAKNVLSDTGDAVLDALFDAVVYNVHGSARANANGLSTFYPIKADADTLQDYADTAAFSKNYLTFIEASRRDWRVPADFSGVGLSDTAAQTPAQTVADDVVTIDTASYLDDNGVFQLTLNQGAAYVADVYFTLYQMDYAYHEYMFMGRDNDVIASDDGREYSDNFRGVWPALNGVFVNLNLMESTEAYNLYSIPILLNGEEMNLRAIYDWNTESYEVLDAVPSNAGSAFAARSSYALKEGDEIEILMVGSNWDSADDTPYTVGAFTVHDKLVLAETPLADGDYLYQYEIVDVLGDVYYSATVIMECKNGQIAVYETEDAADNH